MKAILPGVVTPDAGEQLGAFEVTRSDKQ